MPGGPLACHEGDAIISGIDQLLRHGKFAHVVATQDWHPAGHTSFASTHENAPPFTTIALNGKQQTLWPNHCVQGTPGAALHSGIDWTQVDLVLRKGRQPQIDSYSAFRENHGPDGMRPSTGLAGWLRERGVTEVFICGLARDVCVLWTAQDARDAGFHVQLLWDLSRPVAPGNDDALWKQLANANIATVLSSDMPAGEVQG